MENFRTPGKIAALLMMVIIIAGMYSCGTVKCAKCTITPPALSPYADTLVVINHAIDSVTVAEWIQRFKDNKDSICNNMANGQDSILYNSEAFNKKYILKLLCLKGCIGLRIHHGMDPSFRVHNIITGVDQYGQDLYFKPGPGDASPANFSRTDLANGAKITGTPYAVEVGMGCPSHCP